MFKNLRSAHLSLIASSLTLIALGLLLTDPFNISMNDMTLVVVSGLLLASFGIFAGLLWKETASDERESQLIDRGGRFAYLTGMSVLIIALVVQSFNHSVDVWLVTTIVVMILSKQLYSVVKK